jgi:RHS repeat-associated protein
VKAVDTHDFADREATLASEAPGGFPVPLVTASSYKPLGPLTGLTLGNGLAEARTFNARYDPAGVAVPGRLAWTYTTDRVGNVTAITDGLNPAAGRTYGYQDFHYFLTQGDGPWGTRTWTYDRIGNRLTETKGGETETYSYFPNAAQGHDPRLSATAIGSQQSLFAYDASGNLILISTPESQYEFHYDAARRLARIGEQVLDSSVYLSYDGRGFLSSSRDQDCACSPVAAEPTYSSEGLLYQRTHRSRTAPAVIPSRAHVFYFASRPLATLDNGTLTYLTTDHLGTPALATNSAGTTVWQGGFEPFGADWNGAQEAGVFLRFPGQWEDRTWEHGELASGLYYNVNRWYEPGTGRYTRPDPLRFREGTAPEHRYYAYTTSNPLFYTDPLGQDSRWYAPGTVKNRSPIGICAVASDGAGGGFDCVVIKPGKRSGLFQDIDFVLAPLSCQWFKIGVGTATIGADGALDLSLFGFFTGGGPKADPKARQQFDSSCQNRCECSYCDGSNRAVPGPPFP